MKNKINRYVNKSFLIVDDFMDFKHGFKKMVETLGATDIDLASTAEQAMELYKKKKHDVVLLDFNLGDGLNGQQMLEELSLDDALNHNTITLMVTGETSLELADSNIESHHDGILSKPFNRTTLMNRLDRAYERNEVLKPILEALNTKDYPQAIICCDQLIIQNQYTLACNRIKADIFLRLGKPDHALDVYNEILDNRDIEWALLGRAHCKVHSSRYTEAIEDLNTIIDFKRNAVEAYDAKAECQIAIGQYEDAYRTLEAAVLINANSVHRQRQLAHLAMRYKDLNIAAKALRKVIGLNLNSSRKQPEDYLELLQTLTLIFIGSTDAFARRSSTEIIRKLNAMKEAFGRDIQVSIAALIHAGLYQYTVGKADEGDSKIKSAHDRLESLPDPIKKYVYTEIEFAYNNFKNHQRVVDLYERFRATESHTTDVKKSTSFNKQGMQHFEQRQYDLAFKAFKSAFLNNTSNVNIALNLLQAMKKLLNSSDNLSEFQELLNLCGQTCKKLSNSDQRAAHYHLLNRHLQNYLLNQLAAQRSNNG